MNRRHNDISVTRIFYGVIFVIFLLVMFGL